MSKTITNGERLSFLLSTLKSLIHTYTFRYVQVCDALGSEGWIKLEELIEVGTAATTEKEYQRALELNVEFYKSLRRVPSYEASVRKALGRRGSVLLSNLFDLAL